MSGGARTGETAGGQCVSRAAQLFTAAGLGRRLPSSICQDMWRMSVSRGLWHHHSG